MLYALSQPVLSPAHGKSSQLVDEGKREFNMQTITKDTGTLPYTQGGMPGLPKYPQSISPPLSRVCFLHLPSQAS